jgi:putative ABC transport system permease protein
MDTLLPDIRYSLRVLAKDRGFTIVAVLCLALGIGVNTTVFSVVNAVLLRPAPFHELDRLVTVDEVRVRHPEDESGPSFQNFRDYRDRNRSFASMGAFTARSLTLSDGEEPERLPGMVVSWDLFPTLGVRPRLGRGFRPEDDRPGAAGTVLLSHEVWTRRYHADTAILGRTIAVNGLPHTIVGVMPERFKFPKNEELWVPISPILDRTARTDRGLGVIARLRPGVTPAQARGDLAAVAKQLAVEFPRDNQGWTAKHESFAEWLTPADTRLIILTMMGAVSFVLLIACANVASLMLARAGARQREIAVRAALGAGRGRIVRQLLTESVIVALMAGALGVLVASWGLDLIDASIPPGDQVPYFIYWSIDRPTLIFTLAVSFATGILFGLAPALQAARGGLQAALNEGGRGGALGGRRSRLRSVLVVGEVALSLVLLVGAALFTRSFLNIQRASGGFDTAPLMTMRFYMPGDAYEASGAKTRRVHDVVRRVEALPGVRAAFASNMVPLSSGGSGGDAVVEGRVVQPGDEPRIFWTGVTPHLLRTLGVPLLAGRDFTDAEGADSSGVAIVSRTMARKLWPNADPLGRRFRLAEDTSGHWLTVIGVAGDFYHDELDSRDSLPAAYLPYPYMATRNTGLTIRVAGDPAIVTAAVRRAIRASDPALPLFEIGTMEEVRRNGFWQFRLFGWMFSTFGGIALFLAAIGVYGVIAYSVAQRTREIGVRMALGARSGDVLRLVVGRGLVLATVGVALGLFGAFAVTRVIQSQLYDVSASDPLSFAGVALFLVAIACLASYLPARRATAVDPVVALRAE